MVYAFVLAGGKGSRMGNTEKPKQFLEIGGKPILVWSVEAFRRNPRIAAVLVLCPKEWTSYTESLLAEWMPDAAVRGAAPSAVCGAGPQKSHGGGMAYVAAGTEGKPVIVLAGGATRNETLMNGIRFLEHAGKDDGAPGKMSGSPAPGGPFFLDEDTCLVTHDAVRPLVTDQIIDANIDCVLAGGTCTTAVPATDTLLHAGPAKDLIDHIPDRSEYYMAQTPQSFRALCFRDLYESLTDEEQEILTDASKVFVLKGEPVTIVPGHASNIKVTYAQDLAVADALLASR